MDVLNQIGYYVVKHNEDRWKNKFASESSGKAYKKKMNDAAQSIEESLCPDVHSIPNNDHLFEFVSGDMDISTQNFVDVISLPDPADDVTDVAHV